MCSQGSDFLSIKSDSKVCGYHSRSCPPTIPVNMEGRIRHSPFGFSHKLMFDTKFFKSDKGICSKTSSEIIKSIDCGGIVSENSFEDASLTMKQEGSRAHL